MLTLPVAGGANDAVGGLLLYSSSSCTTWCRAHCLLCVGCGQAGRNLSRQISCREACSNTGMEWFAASKLVEGLVYRQSMNSHVVHVGYQRFDRVHIRQSGQTLLIPASRSGSAQIGNETVEVSFELSLTQTLQQGSVMLKTFAVAARCTSVNQLG